MKSFKSILLLVLLSFGINEMYAQEDNQPRENTFRISPLQYYGTHISPDNAMKPNEFLNAMQKKDSMDVKIEAKIVTCCKKKGCWMDIDLENGTTMKVRFKDYEFFVPKDADGKITIIEGRARREVTDVATLRHYAEDAGKSEKEIAAITKSEEAYTFEAFGVIIK